MIESNPIIRKFLEEARAICEKKPFLGPPNHAMFWAHIDVNQISKNAAFTPVRNSILCDIYKKNVNPQTYQMGDWGTEGVVLGFLNRYSDYYPADILNKAWDIFSEAYAEQAEGDHAFVAANDSREGDCLITSELPVMRGKFKTVTALEPFIDKDHTLDVKTSKWRFDDWLGAQKAQWKNPNHYLDGSPYPKSLTMP